MPTPLSNDIELATRPQVTFRETTDSVPLRTSSLYSRPSHLPVATRCPSTTSGAEVCATLPMIHDLDRRIAAMGGSTIGLDTLASRIQKAKREPPLSPEQRRRELLWHQHESRFYERCGCLFRDLRAAVEDLSQDLILQSYVESDPAGNRHFRGSLVKLRVALDGAHAELADAEREYTAFWAESPRSVWV